MRKIKKKYKRPEKMWSKERIETEKVLVKDFGLKKKREIWKAQTLLRKYRRLARNLAAKKDKKMEKELIEKLSRLGILEKNAGLDNVLELTVEEILNRRLQTVVHKLGLANTPNHARQLIVHGHITVNGRKMPYPGYLVPKEKEADIKIVLEEGKKKPEKKLKKEEKPKVEEKPKEVEVKEEAKESEKKVSE